MGMLYSVRLNSPIPDMAVGGVAHHVARELGKDPLQVEAALLKRRGDIISLVPQEKAQRYAEAFEAAGLDVSVVQRAGIQDLEMTTPPVEQKGQSSLGRNLMLILAVLVALAVAYETGARRGVSLASYTNLFSPVLGQRLEPDIAIDTVLETPERTSPRAAEGWPGRAY